MWPAFLCFCHRSYLPYGGTTSPWCVKSKPFHLCLVRFVPTAAGNATSTASLCMWEGHHLFPGLVSTYFLLSLAMCLPGTWVVSIPSDYLLWFWAFRLCSGLSSFWREFSLQLDTSQCCLKFWIQDTQGLCIVLSWGTSLCWICCHTRSGGQRAPRSPTPLPWPGWSRSSLVLPFLSPSLEPKAFCPLYQSSLTSELSLLLFPK